MTVKRTLLFKQTTLGYSDFQEDWITRGSGLDSTSFARNEIKEFTTDDVFGASIAQITTELEVSGYTAADFQPSTIHSYFTLASMKDPAIVTWEREPDEINVGETLDI